MRTTPLESILLVVRAVLLGVVAASVASASPVDPAVSIANGDNAQLSLFLQAHPEAVFDKFGGSTLLLQAVQAKNVDAVVELIGRGADWLVETSDGVPFCKFASSRLVDVQPVGSAIKARLLSERQLLDQGRYRDFIDLRLTAQQGSDYLEATRTTCGDVLEWSDYELGWRLLLRVIDGPKTDEEADSLFREFVFLKLVDLPPLPTSRYIYTETFGSVRKDLEQRAGNAPFMDESPWSEIVEHLLRRNMKASIASVLSSFPSAEQLSELFIKSSALEPHKELRYIIDHYTYSTDNSRRIASSPSFLSMVITAGLWSKNSFYFRIGNLVDSGEFYAVIPEAIIEFENGSSRELLNSVLDGELPPHMQTCQRITTVIGGELYFDDRYDNCAIDERVFFRTDGSRLTFEEFIRLSHFGVTIGYSYNNCTFYCVRPTIHSQDIKHVAQLLWRLTHRGIASEDEVYSFVNDQNLMKNYDIQFKDIKEYLLDNFVTGKKQERAISIDLVAVAKSRGLNCKKAQEGWTIRLEDIHRCDIYLNGRPFSAGLMDAAAATGMTVYP
ncbi:hypothetical protein NKI19_02375 [Mesorhizobium sp. M0751]|uniref:hypothetical protein n=1 Tax=unclassified Mesorhizobium TaxID=325217 RepID=UPI003335AE6E